LRLNHSARSNGALHLKDPYVPARPGSRSSSITRIQRRWLIVSILPVLVVAIGLHELTSQWQLHEAQDSAASLLGQTLAAQWRTNDRTSIEEIRRVCERLQIESPVLATAVFNARGEQVAQTVRHNDLVPLLVVDPLSTSSSEGLETLAPPEALAGAYRRLQRVDLSLGPQFDPDRPARVVLLLGAIDPIGTGAWRWWYFGLLTAAAAGGLLLADWTLRRRIARPISSLLQSTASRHVEPGVAEATCEPGELGELSRWVHDLKDEAFHWRGQAERVERRMALQLASQTREISRDLRKFQREAWLDSLTRVKNRRFLDEQLPIIVAAHREADLDLSLVMLDLDHFKRLNDERGHQAGDEVLAFLGELLRQCLRADDIPVRLGGDEFVLILPGVCAEDAVGLTKRLMALFAQRVKVMFDGRTIPSLTAGIAALLNNRPATPAGLLAAADRALYQAKKSGRGGIEISKPFERMSA
jgi:diguanylate cyclase (GGDEF)-like protein